MASEVALALLKETKYFQKCNEGLLKSLAAKMVLKEAEDGYVFAVEGDEVTELFMLETGTLIRTKLALAKGTVQSLSSSERRESATAHKIPVVTVDEFTGRANMTGMYHNLEVGSKYFATVTAKGSCKVWILSGEDFRKTISEQPQNCLDVLSSMSRELRQGSKLLRAIVSRVRSTDDTDDSAGNKARIIRVMCYDTTSWVTEGFAPAIEAFNAKQAEEKSNIQIEFDYTSQRLSERNAQFAAGSDAVCLFVNDNASDKVIQTLSLLGVKMIAMRCAGFDRVDLQAAKAYNITVARVPAYSPYAVAEMAITLLMGVNRKLHKACSRVKMANFTLDAGLMGMDIHGKTIGVMGTGKIGEILCDIILGFGAKLLCFDVFEKDLIKQKGGTYVTKEEIYAQSDVIFLMMPLLKPTYHTINMDVLPQLKKGVIIINTSRGGLVDVKALLKGLKDGIIAGVGMDVYENEQEYFFQDWSAKQVTDDDLVALLGQHNVVMTAHQAFFTKEAVDAIVGTTLDNVFNYAMGKTGLDHPNNCIPPPK